MKKSSRGPRNSKGKKEPLGTTREVERGRGAERHCTLRKTGSVRIHS